MRDCSVVAPARSRTRAAIVVARKADNTRDRQLLEVIQVWDAPAAAQTRTPRPTRDEDGDDNCSSRPTVHLACCEARTQCRAESPSGISAVVNQVGQERDRTRKYEHNRLQSGRHARIPADGYCPDAFTRTKDGRIYPTVRVTVPVMFVVTFV